MKILIVTTLHKRPELSKIVLDYYRHLRYYNDIELLCCGSCDADRNLAYNCGWLYTEAANSPLAQKHNALFAEARKWPHDAIMLIGSDDLISPEIIKYYKKNYSAETDHMVGFNMLHFYSIEKNQLIYFKGYENDNTYRVTMGAGRLFPKAVLEKMNYNLWNESRLNRGLDSVVSTYLKNSGIKEIELKLQDIPGAMILDIKSETNITEYERLLTNCIECDVQIAFDKFPNEMNLIHKLYEQKKNIGRGDRIDNSTTDNRNILDSVNKTHFLSDEKEN